MAGTIFFNTKALLIVLLLGSALLVLCGYVTWTGMFVNLTSSRADPTLSQAGMWCGWGEVVCVWGGGG